MACKQCNKDITGNFIVINIHSALMDNTKTWINLPQNTYIDLNFAVSTHSTIIDKFPNSEEEFIHHDELKTVDLFSKMANHDNCSALDDRQAEEYFCTKECLIRWFGDQIKDLPNP